MIRKTINSPTVLTVLAVFTVLPVLPVLTPLGDIWDGLPLGGDAPTVDRWHTAVWTGNEMIVWGGEYMTGSTHNYLADGARYWCEPI